MPIHSIHLSRLIRLSPIHSVHLRLIPLDSPVTPDSPVA
jgi:hypothetical protein